MSRKHPGSRHYAALDAKRWSAARKAALARSGHRLELSGLASALEVHHRVKLEDGGDPYSLDNLQGAYARGAYRACTAPSVRTLSREAWRVLVAEIANT